MSPVASVGEAAELALALSQPKASKVSQLEDGISRIAKAALGLVESACSRQSTGLGQAVGPVRKLVGQAVAKRIQGIHAAFFLCATLLKLVRRNTSLSIGCLKPIFLMILSKINFFMSF